MADIQIVDVYQYKSSIPIETLLSGYSDEEVYAECIERVVPISFPYGTSLAGVKEIIENFINIPKSLQRISFNIGEEIDDEKLLLPQQITTLHVECFRAAPRSNTNNNNNNYSDEDYGVEKSIIEISNSQYLKHGKNRDETGKIIPLKIAYLDTKRIEIDARTTYKISDIKDDIKIKNPELAAYTNSELRFLSDPPMEDNKYLNEYLEDIFNEGNNTYCFRLVVRPEDGAFSPSVAKGLVGLISEESAQKDLLRLIDEAKGQDIHVFPVKNIPANYWWVLKIKDYSEKAERNKELVTEKQKKVIYDYTGDSWYAKINFLLATLTTPPKIEREFIETLILALCDSYQTNLPDQVVRYLFYFIYFYHYYFYFIFIIILKSFY